MHDVHALDMLVPEAGAIYVWTVGISISTAWIGCTSFVLFSSRAPKFNLNFHRVYSACADRTTGVIADQTIALDGHCTREDYPVHLRRVRFRDE
jgi:Transposase DDE domain